MSKRTYGTILVLALLVVAGAATTQELGIRNSKHDFSMSGNGNMWGSQDTNQICIFCHTPHNALSTRLLWNRTLPPGPFSVYTSSSMNATTVQPKADSLRCLSCHDGSVAIDAFNEGRTWTPRMMAIGDVYYPGSPYGSGGANIGGNFSGVTANNLTDDHPVSFVFNDALATADGHLQAPATVEAAGLPLWGTDPAAKTLECSTCHEVHRKYGNKWLLRVDVEDASKLCLSCHIK